MKKIVLINVVCNGSTGKIMCDIASELKKIEYDEYCFFGRGKPNNKIKCIKVGNIFSIITHLLLARLGFNGHGSYFATKRMIKKLKKINPDIIHLHNIHGYYLNLKLLFNYLKKEYHGKIIWTLHDCWAFTGHCAYFTMVKCNKWQKECFKCPQLSSYPKTFFDTSLKEFNFKKQIFTELNNLVITTPSYWLKSLVQKSFLSEYSIQVIANGINLDIFKPIVNNDIYDKYHLPKDKKIILGIANIWEKRKGLDIFLEITKYLQKDEVIVLVGLTEKQKKNLPENIIGITKVSNQEELASLYTSAKVFLNPSREETFSLVTIEALCCHIPVIVCGMSAPKELISEKCGIVVNSNNPYDYYKAYQKVINKKYDCNDFVETVKKYNSNKMKEKFMELYKE